MQICWDLKLWEKRIFEETDGTNGVGKGEEIAFDISHAMCSSNVVKLEVNRSLPSLDEQTRTMRAVVVRRMVESDEKRMWDTTSGGRSGSVEVGRRYKYFSRSM